MSQNPAAWRSPRHDDANHASAHNASGEPDPPLLQTPRHFLESAGQESTPWFRLTQAERTVVESEMELFRQAIRAAEEEQDILANFNAPAAEPTAAAAGDTAAENCACPGCSAVAALLELLARMRMGFEAAVPQDTKVTMGPFAVRLVPAEIRRAPLTDQQRERLQKAAEDAIAQWVAAGKPLKVTDDLFGPSLFDRVRLDYWNRWKQASPRAFVRDLGV
ncbi:hypothetical protein ABZ612_20465 [Streptomyces avermitilis]|uniref:hypothetical protein n=1 Tax=Streptomyces avermitilis TaxID=33903 RepID=UPI0033EB1F16